MSVLKLATLAPVPTLHADLARRLAVSARHRSPTTRGQAWLAAGRQRGSLTVRRVPFGELAGWSVTPGSGDLVHDSRRLFAVRGIQVRTNHGHVPLWWQPILHQPEMGIIGFLAKEFDGVLHLLAQVKTEPGNVNPAQLAPTVQTTHGVFLRSHRGAAAPYLEYFLQRRGRVLVDVVQSEPGSWVLGRQNRNMVLEVTDDLEHDDDYAWLTLGQIYELMKHPHLVDLDTRTVLACLPMPAEPPAWHESPATPLSLASGSGAGRRSGLGGWLARRQAHYQLSTSRCR